MPATRRAIITGLAITWVHSGGHAARAAPRRGDVVQAADNQPVNDASAMASAPPGTNERLAIRRTQEVFTLPVAVGRRPAELGSD